MAVMEVCEAPARVEQQIGPVGRLGRWAADHLRLVALAWGIVAVVLAIFAPSVETALSGAGWQANGSESVSARSLIEQDFAGLSSSAPMVVLHSPSSPPSRLPFEPSSTGWRLLSGPIAGSNPSRRPGAAPPSRPTVIRQSSSPAREGTRRRWSPPPAT